jgi:phosphopantetheine--protein transferase-like protein
MLPADIEIEPDAHGRPTATGRWTKGVPSVPHVSIAHTDDAAIAIAGDADACIGIGVDIELLGRRGEDYHRLAFTPAERALLSRLDHGYREEWALRFWCAKEAVAKSLGRGLLGRPQCLVVEEVSESTGEVRLAVHGELRQPVLGNQDLVTAMTARTANRVTAVAAIKSR